MNMKWITGLIFAGGWGAILVWLAIFIMGMGFNNGVLLLKMNTLHEGWFEVGFLSFFALIYPFALRYFWLRDS